VLLALAQHFLRHLALTILQELQAWGNLLDLK
jgi:hypothetical protein